MQVKSGKERDVGGLEPLLLPKVKSSCFSNWNKTFPNCFDEERKFAVSLLSQSGREKDTFEATFKKFCFMAKDGTVSIKADTSYNEQILKLPNVLEHFVCNSSQNPSLALFFSASLTKTHLHYDERDNVISVIGGSKFVVLIPYEAGCSLSLQEKDELLYADNEEKLKNLSFYKRIPVYFVRLEENDRLYIPMHYFHYVHNLSLVLSIACWRDHVGPAKKFLGLFSSKSKSHIEIAPTVPKPSKLEEKPASDFILPSVPSEIWEYITFFFSNLDLVHFSEVNKTFNKIANSDIFWKKRFIKDFVFRADWDEQIVDIEGPYAWKKFYLKTLKKVQRLTLLDKEKFVHLFPYVDRFDDYQVGELICKFVIKGFISIDAASNFLLEASREKKYVSGYVRALGLEGTDLLYALRIFLSILRLPGEAPKIDRIMESFSSVWFSVNQENGNLSSADSAYLLSFSIIMLNTDGHNPHVHNKMSVNSFVRNCSGIGDKFPIPTPYLESIYQTIYDNELALLSRPVKLTNSHSGWMLDENLNWIFCNIHRGVISIYNTPNDEYPKIRVFLSPSTYFVYKEQKKIYSVEIQTEKVILKTKSKEDMETWRVLFTIGCHFHRFQKWID